MTSYPGRWLVVLGYVGWVLCVLLVVACLVAPSGSTTCDLSPGASIFGEASRSWLPPGTTCTWDLSLYGLSSNVVDRPSPLRLVVVVAALVGLPLVRYVARLLKRAAVADSVSVVA